MSMTVSEERAVRPREVAEALKASGASGWDLRSDRCWYPVDRAGRLVDRGGQSGPGAGLGRAS